MGKVLFVLELPEPKLRKEHAPPSKRHKDATKYSRKQKHKARRDEAPDNSGASFLGEVCRYAPMAYRNSFCSFFGSEFSRI